MTTEELVSVSRPGKAHCVFNVHSRESDIGNYCHLEFTGNASVILAWLVLSLLLKFLKFVQRLKRGHIGYINRVKFVYQIVSFGTEERQLGRVAVLRLRWQFVRRRGCARSFRDVVRA